MPNIIIQETTYEFLKPYEDQMLTENVLLDPSFYRNGVENKESISKYFLASINGESAGTSTLVKYLNSNDQTWKIYHRASYTFPKFRKQGVWTSLMSYKVNYCYSHNLNDNDKTSHHVSCDISDQRYRQSGWHLHGAKESEIKGKKMFQATWFLDWAELKKLYNIVD
jgi:hypothetical protein